MQAARNSQVCKQNEEQSSEFSVTADGKIDFIERIQLQIG